MGDDGYQSDCPGMFIQIEAGHKAYPPNRLPPEFPMERALLGAVAAVGSFEGEAALLKNNRLIIHPLMIKEAVDSNKIEATYTFVKDILLQKLIGPPDDPMAARDQGDVLRYFDALETGAKRIAEGWPLSGTLIRALHRIIVEGNADSNAGPGFPPFGSGWSGSPRGRHRGCEVRASTALAG